MYMHDTVCAVHTVWSRPPIVVQYFACAANVCESGRKWRERVGAVERREKERGRKEGGWKEGDEREEEKEVRGRRTMRISYLLETVSALGIG